MCTDSEFELQIRVIGETLIEKSNRCGELQWSAVPLSVPEGVQEPAGHTRLSHRYLLGQIAFEVSESTQNFVCFYGGLLSFQNSFAVYALC